MKDGLFMFFTLIYTELMSINPFSIIFILYNSHAGILFVYMLFWIGQIGSVDI